MRSTNFNNLSRSRRSNTARLRGRGAINLPLRSLTKQGIFLPTRSVRIEILEKLQQVNPIGLVVLTIVDNLSSKHHIIIDN